jgi:hypothetical protein
VVSDRQVATISRVEGNALDRHDAQNEGGIRIQAPFSPAYLAALKATIPYTYRRWLSDLQVMAVAYPYNEAAIEVVERFFDVQYARIEDSMSLAERFWSKPAEPGEEFAPGLKLPGRYRP